MKPGQTMTELYKRRFTRIYTFLPLAWGGMTWEQSLADLKHLPFNFPSMAGHLWFMYPLISIYRMGVPGRLIETPLLEWSWEFCTSNVLLATFGLPK